MTRITAWSAFALSLIAALAWGIAVAVARPAADPADEVVPAWAATHMREIFPHR